ncbi:MAG TPA: glycine betaine ABC transporter substrate-binding protein [Candidatus Binatia bacterium]|jgi:osmoprotectant transport system permease protein|nr:glycine betaine ABC transporter substrate-binding protein [Candidatus Binatia bacterium]
MNLWEFLLHNRAEVFRLSMEHLFLVGLSTGIAIVIGVPLGILLTRWPRLSKPVLGFANIMQTVPSLALFGFLIPLNIYLFHVRIIGGIGARTAIVALVLYALLPIIRNTFTGINSVDPAIREAGRGIGMTDRQLLFQVEVPLALGVIVAGVRVATVISVGTATIAAAIDAGGLGRYIFRGLRMNDNTLILAGAVPAALMALVADFLLGWVEKLFATGVSGWLRNRKVALGALLLALTAGGVWFATMFQQQGTAGRVVVGSKDFTEQIILGELLSQVIETRAGLPVTRRFDLGGNLAHEALVAGELDAYVEYTGTAFTAILKQRTVTDPKEVYRRVKEEYATRFDVEWTEPLGFNNTFAILVRGEDARRYRLKTISDAAKYASKWRAGFGQDFMSRPDGYQGFARAYGLKFMELREMDLSLTYRALVEKQVDLIAGNSTDGLITRYDLVRLVDDRRYFPPYDAVPVIRREILQKYPVLRDALKSLGGLISVEEMRQLNFQVDGEHRAAKEVVDEFLKKKGLKDSVGRVVTTGP